MKLKLMGAALVFAMAGFGCQRTYDDRGATAARNESRTETVNTQMAQQEELPATATTGEAGQQADFNADQDMAGTDDTSEAFGGSGTAGMDTAEEPGIGGGGAADGGMMMKGHTMMNADAGTMMKGDAGMMMKGDAGMRGDNTMMHDSMMMGADAGMMTPDAGMMMKKNSKTMKKP